MNFLRPKSKLPTCRSCFTFRVAAFWKSNFLNMHEEENVPLPLVYWKLRLGDVLPNSY